MFPIAKSILLAGILLAVFLKLHRKNAALPVMAASVLVPGVTSFCAVAARLNTSLCEQSDRLLIVPASHKDMEDCLDVDANLVFMKAGREIGALKETLRTHGLLDKASLVANCGMDSEQVWQRFEDMPENTGYFSVVVVKKEEQP